MRDTPLLTAAVDYLLSENLSGSLLLLPGAGNEGNLIYAFYARRFF